MRRLEAGTAGVADAGRPVAALAPDEPFWDAVLSVLCPSGSLRPVQRAALEDARVLDSRRNLVVVAPTNSGKTAVGYLVLLQALRRSRRAVLLEPLRALAQEKRDELATLLGQLPWGKGVAAPRVRISTGDYRLEHETFADPPPSGELLVATPERLDAILRNPASGAWLDTVAAVVVDEAHLIGTARRGPTLEYVLAALQVQRTPPRLALLSATVGAPERLVEWLQPCDLVQTSERSPPLVKEVLVCEGEEKADAVVTADAGRILKGSTETSLLLFVYQRTATTALARRLTEALPGSVGAAGALAYHSGMSSAARAAVRETFLAGRSRCVVTTTALALGVNLPASHVLVRDTTFPGEGRLGVDEILQMLGRAGRGATPGWGGVILRPSDDWEPGDLAASLRAETLPTLHSAFEEAGRRQEREAIEPVARVLATVLARRPEEGWTLEDLQHFLSRLLGGRVLRQRAREALDWLADPARRLAYRSDADRYHLTVLGTVTVRAMLPLPFAAGAAQLLRDLLSIDPEDQTFARWTPTDHLFVASLLSDRARKPRRFSEALARQIEGWVEAQPQEGKSVLFRQWIAGSETGSRAAELLGSLGIEHGNGQARGVLPRALAYQAMLQAILLEERSRGVATAELERRWGLTPSGGLEGLDEDWRDTMLWLLSGLAQLLEVRVFYFHLREECQADADRVHRVKQRLARMRHQLYELREQLTYCSPLGGLLRGVRGLFQGQDGAVAGEGTLRRLEAAGYRSLREVATLDVPALTAIGVRPAFARQIRRYLQRRLQ